MDRLGWVAAAVFALNVPCGIYRARVKKFSVPWFVAVHAPVPLVVALRIGAGIGFSPVNIPVLIAAYFAGQFLGGRIGQRRLQG